MTQQYMSLILGENTKWVTPVVDYTFLQFLPDYYLDGMGYAPWYSDFADTNQEFSKFTAKQKEAVYFILETDNSIKMTADIETREARCVFRAEMSAPDEGFFVKNNSNYKLKYIVFTKF